MAGTSSGGASMKLGGALAPPNIFDFYIYVFEIFKNFEISLNYR